MVHVRDMISLTRCRLTLTRDADVFLEQRNLDPHPKEWHEWTGKGCI
jgi:hypothetical protein